MAHSYHHSVSSSKRWGGVPADYIAIHSWFDESKEFSANAKHRILRHHTQGIFECERKFGITITNSDGKSVPVRLIGEQHMQEDFGRVPSVEDWLSELTLKGWMVSSKPLSKELK